MCETADECLACNYFRRVYFFFAPIILNMFQDMADCQRNSYLRSRLYCVIVLLKKDRALLWVI